MKPMENIQNAIAEVVAETFGVDHHIALSRPDPQFGDYATNIALQLAKGLGKNPRDVAEQITQVIKSKLAEHISEVSVAGPGFINLRLSDNALLAELRQVTKIPKVNQEKTVLVEYSDPNPFKPLHAGHLYTTLVGNTIAKLIEKSGAKVVRINYGGDVGLHVGKTMWSMVKNLGGENPEKLEEISVEARPAYLGARYVEGNTAYEDDEVAKAEIIEANKRVYELQKTGDRESAFAQIYWTCRAWSYEYFKSLYTQLQVDPFDRFIPESEVTELGEQTVKDQLAKGVYKQSDGAVIYDGESKGLHTRVFINSAGLPTYEAKETGLIQTKWNDYHYDKSIIITANEQDQYMQVVLASVSEFEPEIVARTQHITHGVVKLAGGVKMSSRKGNTVTALEIIDAAHSAAKEQGRGANEDTVLAAIKYAFAKNRIGGDVIYDPKDSIALEGNSGPYLQYAHARAKSILAKASSHQSSAVTSLEAGERSLVLKLTEFPEVITHAIEELAPHLVCTYLYDLAQVFNRFYEQNRVIGDPREAERLVFVAQYAEVLKNGLDVLGIHAPDSM